VACSVGSTQPCGSSVGECKPGKQICESNGQWGKCEGGVTPGIEVCDGKDNNCNGQIDEGVMQVCPLQKGVCAGASGICGGDGGCVAAYGPHYEPFETSCDGLDNDCDGNVDRSAAVNISQSPGIVSRKPSAVHVPGSDSVLVLYEEGQKIAARVVGAAGSVSAAVSPSVTVDAVTHAWAPSIAVGETLIVAAWAEDTGAARRVMVASLDGTTGQSTLPGGGALFALSATNPTEVAVAVDEAAGRLVLAVADNGVLKVAGFSSTLPPPMGSPSFLIDPFDGQGQHPSLTPIGGGGFLLGNDESMTGAGVRSLITESGQGPFDASLAMAKDISFFPVDAGMGQSFFLSGQQIFTSSCQFASNFVSCFAATPALGVQAADMDALRISWPDLATWQQGVASPQVFFAALGNAAGVGLGPGKRPVLIPATGAVLVFFDTESVTSSSVASDEVYFIRSCR
jgi:hypothetical protein